VIERGMRILRQDQEAGAGRSTVQEESEVDPA
jgi:hypothetical protein